MLRYMATSLVSRFTGADLVFKYAVMGLEPTQVGLDSGSSGARDRCGGIVVWVSGVQSITRT